MSERRSTHDGSYNENVAKPNPNRMFSRFDRPRARSMSRSIPPGVKETPKQTPYYKVSPKEAQKLPWVSPLFPPGYGDARHLLRKPTPRIMTQYNDEVSISNLTPLRRSSAMPSKRIDISDRISTPRNVLPSANSASTTVVRQGQLTPRRSARQASVQSRPRRANSLDRRQVNSSREEGVLSSHRYGCCNSKCLAPKEFVQPNGFCASCNMKAKDHIELSKLGFIGSFDDVPVEPSQLLLLHLQLSKEHAKFMPKALVAPHPSIYGGTIDNPKEGVAFGGRLRFSVVQRDFDPTVGFLKIPAEGARSMRSADPDSPAVLSVVNYQMLRLTFLYNKAIGQGLFQIEFFQHFDVDCRGEIGESCLSDGLKRLGIFLTTAETNTFFKRFKPNGKGMVTFNNFLGTLGGEIPTVSVAKVQAPVKQDRREIMIKKRDAREAEIEKENFARAATAAGLLAKGDDSSSCLPLPPKKSRVVDDGELMGIAGKLQKEMKQISVETKEEIDLVGYFLEKDPDEDGYLPNAHVLRILSKIGFQFNWTREERFRDVFARDENGFFSEEICYMDVCRVINAKSLYEALSVAKEAGKTPKLGKSQREKIKKKKQERYRDAQIADAKGPKGKGAAPSKQIEPKKKTKKK